MWHRRAGKEKSCWNYLITQAIQITGIYYYLFPTFAQGRKVLWDGMDKQGFKFIDHIPKDIIEGKPNASEMKIRLKTGSLIQVVGTDNWDSIVGTNPRGAVFSEYSLQAPSAWQYLRPIFRENDGWAIFNFTPRGKNHSYELFQMAQGNDDWFCQKLSIEDTDVLSEKDMDIERAEGMSEDMIQQEYYCSFDLGLEGSYYGKLLDDMTKKGQISNVAYQSIEQVHTVWDLGIGDSTAILFYQIIGSEVHIIDSYEATGEGLPHYAKVLRDKPYMYGEHYAPHDIEHRELGTGITRKEIALSLGIDFNVIPKLPVDDGIEMARSIFPCLWIDHSNKQFIKALTNYRKAYDDKRNCYQTRPLHDWSSDYADAFRYLATVYRSYYHTGMKAVDTVSLRRKAYGYHDPMGSFFSQPPNYSSPI